MSIQNSAVLTANSARRRSPAPPAIGDHRNNGTCRKFSYPVLYNNVFWQNRSFYIGVGALGAGTLNQQNVVTLYNAFTRRGTEPATADATTPTAAA